MATTPRKLGRLCFASCEAYGSMQLPRADIDSSLLRTVAGQHRGVGANSVSSVRTYLQRHAHAKLSLVFTLFSFSFFCATIFIAVFMATSRAPFVAPHAFQFRNIDAIQDHC
jgi:hypothetical protein